MIKNSKLIKKTAAASLAAMMMVQPVSAAIEIPVEEPIIVSPVGGKNVGKVLFLGGIGATACYFTAAVSSNPIIGLLACGLTGFCVSMLWPGNLIVASEKIPKGGVFLYAMMAAGGDLGASVGPQLVGIVTDAALEIPALLNWASELALSPEQFGMKLGMLVGMLFPLISIGVYYLFFKSERKTQEKLDTANAVETPDGVDES